MKQVKHKAICISNKYSVQIEHLYFKWDKFIPTLEKEFPDILNEMVDHSSQWQPLNANENRSIQHRNREPYSNFRRGTKNRAQTRTTPSPTMMHPNMADIFHHLLHSTPDITIMHHQNTNFINNTYLVAQTRGYVHHITPFRMRNTSQEQQGFHHRVSSRLEGLIYGTFLCGHYNHGLHNTIITANCPKAIPFGQARGTIYEGSLLLSVTIDQTIIQAALSLKETFNGTTNKFEAWTESIENAAQISGQDILYL